jgi:hypothetical protein
VLHLHKFPSSSPLGPVYGTPGPESGIMFHAKRDEDVKVVHKGNDSQPKLHVDSIYAATEHAF